MINNLYFAKLREDAQHIFLHNQISMKRRVV